MEEFTWFSWILHWGVRWLHHSKSKNGVQQRSYRQVFSHLLDQENDWLLKEEWFGEANTLLTSLEKSKLVTDWWPLQQERGPFGLHVHLHSMENESLK